jgi:inorganic pyrophosphatase
MQGNLSEIEVIIEIPKGCRNKYEYDPERKVFRLDRRLFSSVHYPSDYGFVPETLAEDEDPLDEGKESVPEGWEDVDSAMSIIDQARERYVRNRMAGNR